MSKPCERCGTPPPTIKQGPFAGSSDLHDYCAHCSKDLCAKCMEEGHCRESQSGRHHAYTEDEEGGEE